MHPHHASSEMKGARWKVCISQPILYYIYIPSEKQFLHPERRGNNMPVCSGQMRTGGWSGKVAFFEENLRLKGISPHSPRGAVRFYQSVLYWFYFFHLVASLVDKCYPFFYRANWRAFFVFDTWMGDDVDDEVKIYCVVLRVWVVASSGWQWMTAENEKLMQVATVSSNASSVFLKWICLDSIVKVVGKFVIHLRTTVSISSHVECWGRAEQFTEWNPADWQRAGTWDRPVRILSWGGNHM